MANVSPAAALAGKWTYRSFLNDPTLIGDDPNTAPANLYALLFAEAVFTFAVPDKTTLTGAIDWTGGGRGGLPLHPVCLYRQSPGPALLPRPGDDRPSSGDSSLRERSDGPGAAAQADLDRRQRSPSLSGRHLAAALRATAPRRSRALLRGLAVRALLVGDPL